MGNWLTNPTGWSGGLNSGQQGSLYGNNAFGGTPGGGGSPPPTNLPQGSTSSPYMSNPSTWGSPWAGGGYLNSGGGAQAPWMTQANPFNAQNPMQSLMGFSGGLSPWLVANIEGALQNPQPSSLVNQGQANQQAGSTQPTGSSLNPTSAAPSTGGWYQNPQNQGSTPNYVSFGEDQHSQNQNMLRNWFMNSNNAAGTPQMSLMSPSDTQKFWDMPITRGAEIGTVLQNEGWRNIGPGLVAPWAPQGWTPPDPMSSVWTGGSNR